MLYFHVKLALTLRQWAAFYKGRPLRPGGLWPKYCILYVNIEKSQYYTVIIYLSIYIPMLYPHFVFFLCLLRECGCVTEEHKSHKFQKVVLAVILIVD